MTSFTIDTGAYGVAQQSPEWFAIRCGKVTASRISDVMSAGRGSAPSATRANYMAQVIAERLSGRPCESFINSAMQWGIDTEATARAAYSATTGTIVDDAPFFEHPTVEWGGATPDGLIGEDGLIEIKCPNTATHMQALLGAGIADGYMKQMQFQMACSGRAWVDFVSFDPRLPENLQILIRRVERNPVLISEIEAAVTVFVEEAKRLIATLKQRAA